MAAFAATTAQAQTSQPQSAPQPTGQSATEVAKLHYTVIGTRLGNQLYWTVDASGLGRLSGRGLVFSQRDEKGERTGPGYAFADGVVSFFIGPEGYAELRQNFADIVDGKIDQSALDEEEFRLSGSSRDAGANVLSWSGQPAKGSFTLSSLGVNEQGKSWNRRFDEAWLIIARHMQNRRHPGISLVPAQTATSPAAQDPLTLSYQQQNVWTGTITRWRINADRSGWFETTGAISIPKRTSYVDSHYIPKGRYSFVLRSADYQQIRNTLEPYIAKRAQSGTCEGSMSSDQPMSQLNWQGKTIPAGSYRNTLGCQPYADHIRLAELLIAEQLILPH